MIEPTGPTVPTADELLIAGDRAEEDGRGDLAGALRYLAAHPGPDASVAAEILVLAAFGELRLLVVIGATDGGGMTLEAPGLERVAWDAESILKVALTFGEIVGPGHFRTFGYVLAGRGGRQIFVDWLYGEGRPVVAEGSTLRVVVNVHLGQGSIHPIAIRE